MNVLLVATKAPWPAVDGGRLLLANTLSSLAAAGHRVTLVAPVDPEAFRVDEVAAALAPVCDPRLVAVRPGGPVPTLARGWARGEPYSIARHALAPVRREAARLAAAERFDLVHAEQLQALPQAFAAAAESGLPVVLRAQNVESDLWEAAARRGGNGPRGKWLAREARHLAGWEGEAVRRVDAAVALSAEDAERLWELADKTEARVCVAPAPFPASLPPGRAPLPGEPAVVVLGSGGWLPNREATAWFAGEVWPTVRAALPEAVLHLFGAEGCGAAAGSPASGVVVHPAPADSAEAFAPGAVLAVPLRIASGVRMKVLEAWARGVPVVATPEALSGLHARDGREALVARDPRGFTRALGRLHREPELASALIAAGREALREHHDPVKAGRELVAVYSSVLHRRAGG